jgi:hypothetical protein
MELIKRALGLEEDINPGKSITSQNESKLEVQLAKKNKTITELTNENKKLKQIIQEGNKTLLRIREMTDMNKFTLSQVKYEQQEIQELDISNSTDQCTTHNPDEKETVTEQQITESSQKSALELSDGERSKQLITLLIPKENTISNQQEKDDQIKLQSVSSNDDAQKQIVPSNKRTLQDQSGPPLKKQKAKANTQQSQVTSQAKKQAPKHLTSKGDKCIWK